MWCISKVGVRNVRKSRSQYIFTIKRDSIQVGFAKRRPRARGYARAPRKGVTLGARRPFGLWASGRTTRGCPLGWDIVYECLIFGHLGKVPRSFDGTPQWPRQHCGSSAARPCALCDSCLCVCRVRWSTPPSRSECVVVC